MKKKYVKPSCNNAYNSIKNVIPAAVAAVATGGALAGGYVVGRVVKAIEARPEDITMTRSLRRVAIYE